MSLTRDLRELGFEVPSLVSKSMVVAHSNTLGSIINRLRGFCKSDRVSDDKKFFICEHVECRECLFYKSSCEAHVDVDKLTDLAISLEKVLNNFNRDWQDDFPELRKITSKTHLEEKLNSIKETVKSLNKSILELENMIEDMEAK